MVVPLVVRKTHIKLVSETERCENIFISQTCHVNSSQVVMFIVVSREVKLYLYVLARIQYCVVLALLRCTPVKTITYPDTEPGHLERGVCWFLLVFQPYMKISQGHFHFLLCFLLHSSYLAILFKL